MLRSVRYVRHHHVHHYHTAAHYGAVDPVANECNPAKTCNVCAKCCKSQYTDGATCDNCVENLCPPGPAPAPPVPNECNPAKTCNVCDKCCKSYITDGAQCDNCVKTECSTPPPPTPPVPPHTPGTRGCNSTKLHPDPLCCPTLSVVGGDPWCAAAGGYSNESYPPRCNSTTDPDFSCHDSRPNWGIGLDPVCCLVGTGPSGPSSHPTGIGTSCSDPMTVWYYPPGIVRKDVMKLTPDPVTGKDTPEFTCGCGNITGTCPPGSGECQVIYGDQILGSPGGIGSSVGCRSTDNRFQWYLAGHNIIVYIKLPGQDAGDYFEMVPTAQGAVELPPGKVAPPGVQGVAKWRSTLQPEPDWWYTLTVRLYVTGAGNDAVTRQWSLSQEFADGSTNKPVYRSVPSAPFPNLAPEKSSGPPTGTPMITMDGLDDNTFWVSDQPCSHPPCTGTDKSYCPMTNEKPTTQAECGDPNVKDQCMWYAQENQCVPSARAFVQASQCPYVYGCTAGDGYSCSCDKRPPSGHWDKTLVGKNIVVVVTGSSVPSQNSPPGGWTLVLSSYVPSREPYTLGGTWSNHVSGLTLNVGIVCQTAGSPCSMRWWLAYGQSGTELWSAEFNVSTSDPVVSLRPDLTVPPYQPKENLTEPQRWGKKSHSPNAANVTLTAVAP